MGKKNDKRLCWNCDGNVEFEFNTCPYCSVELGSHLSDEALLNPPYPALVTNEEWKAALDEKPVANTEEKQARNDLVALIMLIPGIMFVLFALLLVFFSTDGVFQLQWKSSYAYLYLLGAIPLLIIGYRSLK